MFDQVTDQTYFRRVLRTMGRYTRATGNDRIEVRVRAGTTGNGTSPNYQCETVEGNYKQCYSGLSHKQMRDDAFADGHLTKQYDFSDIQRFLEKLV